MSGGSPAPPGLWRVRAREIIGLGDSIQEWVARLLRVEVSARGGDPTRTSTSGDIRIADEGVDILVSDFTGDSPWIPKGTSVWCCTAKKLTSPGGIEKWARKQLERLGSCPRNQVRLVLNRDIVASHHERIESRLGVRLYSAEKIAEWTSAHLGLTRELLGVANVDGLRTVWQRLRHWTQKYVEDESRRAARERILAHVRGASADPLRVEGWAGIGKTRLVLESLAGQPGLEDRILYVGGPSVGMDGPEYQVLRLVQEDEREAVLVLDECGADKHQLWAEQVGPVHQRLRVITVGRADLAAVGRRVDVLRVEPLPDAEMRDFLGTFGLQPEVIEILHGAARGFVKAAHLLARFVLQNPGDESVRPARLAEEVRSKRIFARALGENARYVEPLALFSDLGWEGDLAVESKIVASHFAFSSAELRRQIGRLRDAEGLVQPRSGRLYVTPDVLANALAVLTVRQQGDQLLGLWDGLSVAHRSRVAMLERLVPLGDEPEVRRLLAAILTRVRTGGEGGGEGGDPRRAEYLRLLARVFPNDVLDALSSAIDSLDVDALRSLRFPRRDWVWTLEHVAYAPELFARAARLLLALAEAESEPYGNNATGVWADLFGLGLAGTQADNDARLSLLSDVSASPSAARRRMAVLAARTMLSEGRSIVLVRDRDALRPQDLAEVGRLHRAAWAVLAAGVADADDDVRREACRAIKDHVFRRALWSCPGEALGAIEAVDLENEEARNAFRHAASDAGRFDEERLSDESRRRLRAALKRLEGTSFWDRLHRWTGDLSFRDWEGTRPGGAAEQACRELAEEALRNPPALERELVWLTSDGARGAGVFAHELGRLDQDARFQPLLEAAASQGQGSGVLALYLVGRSAGGSEAKVEPLLDDWANRAGWAARVAFEASWRAQASTPRLERILRTIRNGGMPPQALATLVWGAWVARLGPAGVARFVEAARETGDPRAASAAVTIIHQLPRVAGDGVEVEQLGEVAIELLGAALGSEDLAAEHAWSELASRATARIPERIVDVILGALSNHRPDDILTARLVDACARSPAALWPRVGERLKADYALQMALRGKLESLPVDVLVSWADEAGDDARLALAHVARVQGAPLPPLARELVVRFARDERVLATLAASHGSGGFVGTLTAWLRARRAESEAWAQDGNPTVARWARRRTRELDAELSHAERVGLDHW